MKTFNIVLILLLAFNTSCQSQEKKNTIMLNYKAQTRGFLYQIEFKNDSIEINNNNLVKSAILTKSQLLKIDSLLNDINFKKIEDNISTNELAVDRAIKGVFELNYNQNSYFFEFSHNNLPKEIENLMKLLESFTN